MKIQRLLIALTLVNLVILLFSLAQPRSAGAQGVAPVLRGRAFEIVDERGRVRASISVVPGDAKFKMPDGTTGYPETVLLRLISPQGRPNVKIWATGQGAGVGLGGETDPAYVSLEAKGASSSLKMTNKDGRQQLIKP